MSQNRFGGFFDSAIVICAYRCYHNMVITKCGNKKEDLMKDFIVLIATVILGVIIAGLILSFRSTAENIRDKAVKEIENIFSVEEVIRV